MESHGGQHQVMDQVFAWSLMHLDMILKAYSESLEAEELLVQSLLLGVRMVAK